MYIVANLKQNTLFGKGSDRRTDSGSADGPLNPEGSCQEVCIMQAVLKKFLKAHVNKNDLTVIYSALQQLCTAN